MRDDGHSITFTYRDNQGRPGTVLLSPERFIHRLLQHVLPRGFQRVRHFAWLSPASKTRFERIAALLDWKASPPLPKTPPPTPQCPRCHKPLTLVGHLPRPPP